MIEEEKLEPMVYEIQDAAWTLGRCSVNHIRNLVRRGLLEKVYIGRRACITRKSIERLLESGGTGKPVRTQPRDSNGQFAA